jgi:hypothetical protein
MTVPSPRLKAGRGRALCNPKANRETLLRAKSVSLTLAVEGKRESHAKPDLPNLTCQT